MASITSERALDVSAHWLNLNTFVSNYVDELFEDNSYHTVGNVVYEDALFFLTEVAGSRYLWAFGGSGFKLDDDGRVLGGTVTGLLVFDHVNNEATDIRMGVDGFKVPLKSFESAALTESDADDEALFSRILSKNDEIYLSDEDDVILGFAGNDIIEGNGGDDFLVGGLGNDTLTGGDGDDVFWFDSKLGKKNIDVITDFESGSDTLLFDSSIFTSLDEGAISEGNLVVGAKALDADDYFIYNNGTLFYDADGSGKKKALAIVTLTGVSEITYQDMWAN